MTIDDPDRTRRGQRTVGLFRNSRRGHFVRFPVVAALTVLGASFAISAVVDIFGSGDVTLEFLAAAAACFGVAALTRGRSGPGKFPLPDLNSAPAVMTMATIAWSTAALGAGLAHLIADSTDNVNTALFEGMAAITTTSMTAVDPDSLPMGLHMFRALMQWAGGLGGIVLAVVAVPILLGRRQMTARSHAGGGARALITGRTRGVDQLTAIYVGFTVVTIGGFALAGMGPFDALAHGMTTVSTGGLSTRSGSLGAFDSAAIEWVGTIAMTVAGLNIGVIWWVLKGKPQTLGTNTELRAFALVFVASVAALALWFGSVRPAALAVSSAMSTTGFTSGSWWGFHPGAQATLLLLMSVGAMGGSAGGGVRYLRLIEAAGYARRELQRQLHPSAVGVVRVNSRAVDEGTLARLNGYIIAYFLVASFGAMLTAVGDRDITVGGAITLAVSALSTTGAQVTDPVAIADLGGLSKWSLATLMLLGRISIYSGIVAIITVVSRLNDHFSRPSAGAGHP